MQIQQPLRLGIELLRCHRDQGGDFFTVDDMRFEDGREVVDDFGQHVVEVDVGEGLVALGVEEHDDGVALVSGRPADDREGRSARLVLDERGGGRVPSGHRGLNVARRGRIVARAARRGGHGPSGGGGRRRFGSVIPGTRCRKQQNE